MRDDPHKDYCKYAKSGNPVYVMSVWGEADMSDFTDTVKVRVKEEHLMPLFGCTKEGLQAVLDNSDGLLRGRFDAKLKVTPYFDKKDEKSAARPLVTHCECSAPSGAPCVSPTAAHRGGCGGVRSSACARPRACWTSTRCRPRPRRSTNSRSARRRRVRQRKHRQRTEPAARATRPLQVVITDLDKITVDAGRLLVQGIPATFVCIHVTMKKFKRTKCFGNNSFNLRWEATETITGKPCEFEITVAMDEIGKYASPPETDALVYLTAPESDDNVYQIVAREETKVVKEEWTKEVELVAAAIEETKGLEEPNPTAGNVVVPQSSGGLRGMPFEGHAPYNCRLCDAGFGSRTAFCEHIRQEHGGEVFYRREVFYRGRTFSARAREMHPNDLARLLRKRSHATAFSPECRTPMKRIENKDTLTPSTSPLACRGVSPPPPPEVNHEARRGEDAAIAGSAWIAIRARTGASGSARPRPRHVPRGLCSAPPTEP